MDWTIRAVEFARATRGWRCEIAFRVPTHRQCTWEDHAVLGGGKGCGLLGLVRSFLDAHRVRRNEIRRLQAIPGPWRLDGTPSDLYHPPTSGSDASESGPGGGP